MDFADMVLARSVLRVLTERQIDLILDALNGHEVAFSEDDRAALRAFAQVARAEFGEVPAADEVDSLGKQQPQREARGYERRSPAERAALIERGLAISRDCGSRLQHASLPDDPSQLLFGDDGLPHGDGTSIDEADIDPGQRLEGDRR